MLGPRIIVTPNMSGTQYILVSAPFVSAPGPSTSTPYNDPYIAPYNVVRMGPFNNPFGWNPLYSSNPQVQKLGGNVPNMHIPLRNVIDPLPFIGQQRQSLIDMNPSYEIQGHMTNYMASGMAQKGLTQSIWAPHSQPQMSQGVTPYLGGTYIPQPNNPYEQPQYTTIPQGNYYSMHLVYNIGNNMIGGPQGSSSNLSSPWFDSGALNTLPFLEMLDILDLYKLTDDPIYHNLLWPPIL